MPFGTKKVAYISGKKITYREQGKGKPWVFLHGLAGNSKSWKFQFNELANDKKIIAWDAPGYGESDCLPSNINLFSETLYELLKYLQLTKIGLVGHSMGGIVAGHFASKYSECVEALVLSCTHVGNGFKKGLPLQENYQNRLQSLTNDSPASYGHKRAIAMLASGASKTAINMASSIAAETRSDGLELASRLIQETNNTRNLKKLKLPVTIVYGDKDPIVPLEKTKELIKLIPHSNPIMIHSAGHAPYLEKPDKFNNVIRIAFSKF